MATTKSNFVAVREFIRERTGMVLDDSKNYFVETRLQIICKEDGYESVDELMNTLIRRPFSELADKVVDQLMVNETYFFRDNAPFKVFEEKVLPKIIEKNSDKKSLRIWCAAASSGQEPFSVCMIIKDKFPALANWKVEFEATDISSQMIERCKSGVYSDVELRRGLPPSLKSRFFKQNGVNWHLSQEIVSMVKFSQLNLVRPWPRLPKPDVVFIRNVLIYFDVETKKKILDNLMRLLGPGGYFFVGGGEIPASLGAAVESLGSGAYQVK